MRFSAIFQFPLPHPEDAQTAAPVRVVQAEAAPAAAPLPELPEDLDQRVRLIGEWQLGEG